LTFDVLNNLARRTTNDSFWVLQVNEQCSYWIHARHRERMRTSSAAYCDLSGKHCLTDTFSSDDHYALVLLKQPGDKPFVFLIGLSD
jgi:hypothetical protein